MADSRGRAAGEFVAGRDLVLVLDAEHGLVAAHGTAVDDALTRADREAVDEAAVTAVREWRAAFDERLTLDGVCLPLVRETPLLACAVGSLRRALGLARALERLRPEAIDVGALDARERRMAVAVANAAAVRVIETPELDPSAEAAVPSRRVRGRPSVRGALSRSLSIGGVPTHLRRGSVLVLSYWPTMAVLDAMLAGPRFRPAIALTKRPTGPRRTLRAARRGGWVGVAGAWAGRRAARRAAVRCAAVADGPASLDVLGLPLERCLHERFLEIVRDGAREDLAAAAVLRRALRSGRIVKLLGASDLDPYPRLAVQLAREAGVPSLLVAHGAYPLPQTHIDMELGDEVALWSDADVGRPSPLMRRDRPVHVVGYPGPIPTPRAVVDERSSSHPARIVVLAQIGHDYTAGIDERICQRHYLTALRAIESSVPKALVILRPHPSRLDLDVGPLRASCPRVNVEVDAGSSILELLTSADLCIGSASAATLQAALVETPVVVLNLTGQSWAAPLDGRGEVPLARDAAELTAVLDRWRAKGGLPGGSELRGALGTGPAVERLLDLVAAGGHGA